MANKLPILNAADYYTMGKAGILGRGGYGQVRLCKNKQSEKFAVKYFKVAGSVDAIAERKKRIEEESEILYKLSHQNITKVYGMTNWKNYVGIVIEYMSSGNLDDFLNNKQLKDIPWALRLRMAVQISEAISYLHNYRPKKLIHGDIKPENILLDEDLTIKLADFGSVNLVKHTSATASTSDLRFNKQHTLYYTAPEFIKKPTEIPTTKMDVYSFGIVLYEFVTRSRPYENLTAHLSVLLQVIVDREQRPDQSHFYEIQSELSPDDLRIFKLLVDQMKKCWSQQASDRPKIRTVCESLHTMLDAIDNGLIEQHIKNVTEKFGKTEKDFDMRKAVSLNVITSSFEETTNWDSSSFSAASNVSSMQQVSSSLTTTLHNDPSLHSLEGMGPNSLLTQDISSHQLAANATDEIHAHEKMQSQLQTFVPNSMINEDLEQTTSTSLVSAPLIPPDRLMAMYKDWGKVLSCKETIPSIFM